MRPVHLLRRTKAGSYPSNVVCLGVDYDWQDSCDGLLKQTARMTRWVGVGFSGAAGVYGPDHWCEGDTAESFWEALREQLQRRGKTTVYCERADRTLALLLLWDFIESGAVDLRGTDERNRRGGRRNGSRDSRMRVVLECPPTVVEARISGVSAGFKALDSANYGLKPSAEGTSARQVCNRLSAFVRGMVSALKLRELGSLKDTVGTQALYSFKRRHMTHLMECHSDDRALNLEGDSYYGGRCECFRLGRVRGPVYHLDVQSMYQFCAANCEVPVALSGFVGELGAGDQPQLGGGCGLIADVTVDTDEPAYPYRCAQRGVTVWPIGVFRTVLCGPELRDAESAGRILKWHRAAWYRMAPALQGYAECTMDMKREYEDNADLKSWSKALGVCLIGKLGQRDRKWVDCESNVFHGPWDSWWEWRRDTQWQRYRSICGCTQTETVSGWSYDALPAVASLVTSLARMRLLNMIRCASPGECYYCDTDALMVSELGYLRLVNSGWVRARTPGYLQVKNISDEVEIQGVKSYDEMGRSVRAGRPVHLACVGTAEPRYWARRSAATACRERRRPQADRIAVPHQRADKYRHGEVTATGEVVPFQLNEG